MADTPNSRRAPASNHHLTAPNAYTSQFDDLYSEVFPELGLPIDHVSPLYPTDTYMPATASSGRTPVPLSEDNSPPSLQGSSAPPHPALSSLSCSSGSGPSPVESSSVGSPTIAGTVQRNYPPLWCGDVFMSGRAASGLHNFDFDSYLAGENFCGSINPSLVTSISMPVPILPTMYASPQVSPVTPVLSSQRLKTSRSQSPYLHLSGWQPYPQASVSSRSQSIVSKHSRVSQQSMRSSPTDSAEGDEEGQEKSTCPDCGKMFKDLKAHKLTHQAERPEKCPIQSCPFSRKGFSRKYDKNRHTLTHYKGLMVCWFCPGAGSSAEKSFNRADVFKRHLTAVHGVEQNPPNGRKKSPTTQAKNIPNFEQDTYGKCPTCQDVFASAQALYEHLDDCVLSIVQRGPDPVEAINERLLASMADDETVRATLERHGLPNTCEVDSMTTEMYEANEKDNDEDISNTSGKCSTKSSPTATTHGASADYDRRSRGGLTWSKGGVKSPVPKGRKKRKNYPPSWGTPMESMTMKRRVACYYEGQRRLVKDDMMFRNDYQARMPLPDGQSYVTNLDVLTLRRAEGFFAAKDEERGPSIVDNFPQVDIHKVMA